MRTKMALTKKLITIPLSIWSFPVDSYFHTNIVVYNKKYNSYYLINDANLWLVRVYQERFGQEGIIRIIGKYQGRAWPRFWLAKVLEEKENIFCEEFSL